MGWVHAWVGLVGLNEKYCGIVAEYCKTHTFHCPEFSHLGLMLFFNLIFFFFLLPEQYTGITDIDILFPLFFRRHSW